ncbi:calmodulin-like protein 3 [Typha angustifolia]|uniref:calmodulin-like protein 3 n=1 Tax=Typha angustifolia TaxID=59011 RepID=UPI003C2B8262
MAAGSQTLSNPPMPTALVPRISFLVHLLNALFLSLLLPLLPSSWRFSGRREEGSRKIPASRIVVKPSPSPASRAGPTMAAARGEIDPAELKRVFQMFDRNGDGRITRLELNDSLENLGIYIPEKDLTAMIDKIDANGDGCVDIIEFGALYQTIMGEKEEEKEEEDMREAFNVFDENGDGFITVDELRSVLASLGIKQGRTAEDCRKMIRNVDKDGDGMVDFNEFKMMMRGGGFAVLS